MTELHFAEPGPEDTNLPKPAHSGLNGNVGSETPGHDQKISVQVEAPAEVTQPVVKLIRGDALAVLRLLEDESVHSIVTDPPYGLSKGPDIVEVLQHWMAGDDYEHKGSGFMGKCLHPDTDLLTRRGWMPVALVTESDEVMSLDPHTGRAEFQPVTATHSYDYDGDLVRVGGRSCLQMVTPNHNVWTDKGLVRADSLPRTFKVGNQGEWRGTVTDEFEVEGQKFSTDALMRFLGLWLGDGYVAHRRNQPWKQNFIGFAVKKQRKIEAIRQSLDGLGVRYTETPGESKTVFYVYDKHLLAWLSPLGGAHSKFIPEGVLDLHSSHLEHLYQGMIETDGTRQGKKGQEVYFTVSEDLADDFQTLCFLTGRSASKTSWERETTFSGWSVGYVLSVVQPRGMFWMERDGRTNRPQPASVQYVPFSGQVHCVTLAEHHIMLSRYDGKTAWTGNSWDSFVPGPSVWRECLRVLKPGGHLLCFAGTRTVDLMGMSIRMAGFEIRDQMQWLYGCLTSDAEVLTERGWKLGVDVEVGDLIAQWNPESEAISLVPVERKYLARWDGPMRVIRNADTDQVLTPNHRVWHRTAKRSQVDGKRRYVYGDDWAVAEADQVTRYRPTTFPLSGFHDGDGIGGDDYASLLGWVWTEGGFDRTGTGVRIYQSPSANPVDVKEIDALIGRLGIDAKRYERERIYRYKETERPYTEVCWFFTGEWAQRVRADLPDKHPTWDLLWAMDLDEKYAFYEAAMRGDGSKSGTQFWQSHEGDLEWFQTLLHLIGKRGRVTMRQAPRTGGSVAFAHRGTTEMQHRHFAAASDEHYTGMVWCVGVPTGAFVARRNGKVFVTGNSGFPKSQNVSKMIDKMAGAEREVTRTERVGIASGSNKSVGGEKYEVELGDIPVTDDAAQWEGWGTALKPAHEPIIVARKPLSVDGKKATVVKNVLAHGTGAINIDASRIAAGGGRPHLEIDPKQTENNAYAGRMDGSLAGGSKAVGTTTEGRWPANFILGHHEDCEQIGTKNVKATSVAKSKPTEAIRQTESSSIHQGSGMNVVGKPQPVTGFVNDDGTETVDAYNCHPDCPVKILDEQSGDRSSPWRGNPNQGKKGGAMFGGQTENPSEMSKTEFRDSGGASRFFYTAKAAKSERNSGLPEGIKNTHPTVKPVKLMAYLVRMVTPPGGTVLDPYFGSGTTMVAATQEGFDGIGIDRDDEGEYLPIAKARVEHAGAKVQQMEWYDDTDTDD